MKKVLFLQIKGRSYGGVWHVNKLVGETLLDNNYQVHIVSIRNNKNDMVLEHHPDLVIKTINEKDLWESPHLIDLVKELKSFHIISFFKMVISKLIYKIRLRKDVKKLQKYIRNYSPDYIITTHYQLLDMIPNEYLSKTIHEQHSSFADAKNNKANLRTFDKYKDKIKFLWLTKATMDNAIKEGYINSSYIYNAVRFKSEKKANVTKNKKLIAISRISKDKSIDKMIDIVQCVFEDPKYKDWVLEIYGQGNEEDNVKKMIYNHEQIKLMGITHDPKRELLTASINLNTSKYEGFSLSILEANECGVPTVSFNFGESAKEQILNDKTGIIANDREDYFNQLKTMMDSEDKLEMLSKNAKEFSKQFQIETIIKEWIKLFEMVENNEK